MNILNIKDKKKLYSKRLRKIAIEETLKLEQLTEKGLEEKLTKEINKMVAKNKKLQQLVDEAIKYNNFLLKGFEEEVPEMLFYDVFAKEAKIQLLKQLYVTIKVYS